MRREVRGRGEKAVARGDELKEEEEEEEEGKNLC